MRSPEETIDHVFSRENTAEKASTKSDATDTAPAAAGQPVPSLAAISFRRAEAESEPSAAPRRCRPASCAPQPGQEAGPAAQGSGGIALPGGVHGSWRSETHGAGGLGSLMFTVGLDDLQGLFQPKRSFHSDVSAPARFALPAQRRAPYRAFPSALAARCPRSPPGGDTHSPQAEPARRPRCPLPPSWPRAERRRGERAPRHAWGGGERERPCPRHPLAKRALAWGSGGPATSGPFPPRRPPPAPRSSCCGTMGLPGPGTRRPPPVTCHQRQGGSH